MRRQSKSIPLIYGGLASLLLIVIAAIALVLVPPSPPQVAEFAPQAQENIDEAPDQQSSRFGLGSGGVCAAGQVCEGPDGSDKAPSKQVIEKARVRRCVGNPPRQIEDPQSPPCVNHWSGNNGGATSKGVTRDEIRVVIDIGTTNRELAELQVEFFNRRFEFYGRRMRPIIWTRQNTCDSAAAGAMATKLDEEFKAFALIGPPNCEIFDAEMARRGLISVLERDRQVTSTTEHFRRYGPHLWSYPMIAEQRLLNLGEMTCKSLVGRPATFGDSANSIRTRSFGLVVNTFRIFNTSEGYKRSSPDPFVRSLERCGHQVRVQEVTQDSNDAYALALNQLLASGVTTVVCMCDSRFTSVHTAASQVGYFPEWLLPADADSDTYLHFTTGDRVQASHSFGLGAGNKRVPSEEQPSRWALREVQADYALAGGPYRALLLLASGIQMAGPKLTPQTFERGLHSTDFPNPGAGEAPFWQGRVGFGPGDYSMLDDLPLVWFDPAFKPPEEQYSAGGLCYVERGARWDLGRWPSRDHQFFDRSQPCR